MLVVICSKRLRHRFIPTIYENFLSIFLSHPEQTNICQLGYFFDLSFRKHERIFEVLSRNNTLMIGHYLKNSECNVR